MMFDSFDLLLKDFEKWCENNFLDVTQTGENTFECGGEKFLLLCEKEGNVFDNEFHFTLNESEKSLVKQVDHVLYKWGTQFCYTSVQTMDKPDDDNVKVFKYLGKTTMTTPGMPFLGIHGQYEILNGSRNYKDWTKKAKWLDISVLGLCEKNTLAGTMAFQECCQKAEIKSILGETISIKNENEFFCEGKVYALNETGWKNLLLINSEINVHNPSQFITQDRLLELGEGIAFVFDPYLFPFDNFTVKMYEQAFDQCYFKLDSVEYESEKSDKSFLEETQKYLQQSNIKPILLCDAYYLDEEDYNIKRSLNTISGHKEVLSQNQYFKGDDENLVLFDSLFTEEDFGEILQVSMDSLQVLCDAADWVIPTGKFKLPHYIMNDEEKAMAKDNDELFDILVMQGWERLGIDKKDNVEEYLDRLEEEIDVIRTGGFVDYFLILHDIIKWCKENDILVGLGRGSAAGSLTAFCLNITKVDPIEYGLLFERFLNKGRILRTVPDIDTDFEAARRDDVKRYMEDKYGHDKVCSLGAYTSLQMKAVFRDFCKLRGVPVATMEYLSNLMFELRDNKNARATKAPWEYIFKLASRSSVLYDFVQEHAEMIEETKLCHAAPRAASVHPCATLILPPGESIYTSVPIRKAEVNGAETIVSEWEGPYVEMAGYLKEDVLGIQQLDKFRMIVNLIKENYGEDVDIYSFPLDQPEVYEMFSKGLNGDVFHLGSKGLTAFCIQVGPDNVRELCAMLALFRPGPMDSNFHMEYVALKNGEREVEYMPGLEGITKETFGLLAYQEQIMQICVQLASFTLVEADNIRKGMGKVDKKFFAEQGEKFFAGALKNGWDKEYLEGLWSKMCAFGGYAFNKCLCGNTQLLRYANNKDGKSTFHPTIAEMYKIRHDKEFAKKNGHEELHWKYKQKGYGTCWSLNESNFLIKNNIKDIYYQGVRDCYTLTTESGKQITCTDNHKFPTSNGRKQLSEINIDEDMIFVSSGWKAKNIGYKFGTGRNYPQKGQQGFQKTHGPSAQLQEFINEIASGITRCECCGKELTRKEVHHIDGNHGNNDFSNLEVLCPSCHKKKHYKMGRTKCGEAGIETHFEKIISIEYVGPREVYDVEMDHPYHTLTTSNGIVTSNSHALCYAVTAYICQYLKWKWPLPYWITALQFASDENLPRFISEINKTGEIHVTPPDINKSKLSFYADFDSSKIIWSISKVKQCGDVAVSFIFEEREKNGPFFDLQEFLFRCDKRKVNKSVVENLILAGAFDDLEGLVMPSQRKRLINKYREIMNVKVDKKKDWLTLAIEEGKADSEWWWILQQKRVSGLAFFNWEDLVLSWKFEKDKYVDLEEYEKEDLKVTGSRMVITGGIVTELEHKSSKKGDYCKFRIEQNYSFAWVTVWNDHYVNYEKEFLDCVGKIVLLKGRAYFDAYKNENALQSDQGFDLVVMS